MEDFDKAYREKQSLLTKLSWQRGDHDFLRKSVTRTCVRKGCENLFTTKPSDPKQYCSHTCSAIIRNTGRVVSEDIRQKISKTLTTTGKYVRIYKCCLLCTVALRKGQLKYCSLQCQSNYDYQKWVKSWKEGMQDGGVGIVTRNISGYLKRYLHEKFEHKCSRCDWDKTHPITGKVPLEVEHIDGNAENNKEENLTLLCPNCHALTPFYKNLNKGNGRKWRMDKYIKNMV